jgi:branched-chain amino acid aminotransferase
MAPRDREPCAEERDLTPYDLYTADEAFLCSTADGIFPVVQMDWRTVGPGTLESVTQRVSERYWEPHLSGPDVTPVLD